MQAHSAATVKFARPHWDSTYWPRNPIFLNLQQEESCVFDLCISFQLTEKSLGVFLAKPSGFCLMYVYFLLDDDTRSELECYREITSETLYMDLYGFMQDFKSKIQIN